MKKIFLSLPMHGRSQENINKSIEKMSQIARIIFDGEEIEILNSIVKMEDAPEGAHKRIWCLGNAIQVLAQADVLLSVQMPFDLVRLYPGVEIERQVFQKYHGYKNASYVNYTNPQSDCGNSYFVPISYVMSSKELTQIREENKSNLSFTLRTPDIIADNYGNCDTSVDCDGEEL